MSYEGYLIVAALVAGYLLIGMELSDLLSVEFLKRDGRLNAVGLWRIVFVWPFTAPYYWLWLRKHTEGHW